MCQQAKLNFSITSIESPFFHTSEPALNTTLMNFLNSSSTSPVGQLLMSLTLSSFSDEMMAVFNKASMHPRYPLKYRGKRDLFQEKDMAWAWFPSWSRWGIDLMKRVNKYAGIIDEIMEKNSDDITKLNIETKAIREQLELHELAIESMSAALTGLL